jgi:hypothetical protein
LPRKRPRFVSSLDRVIFSACSKLGSSGRIGTVSQRENGVLAQLVERLNGIEEVRGSNPLGSSPESFRDCRAVALAKADAFDLATITQRATTRQAIRHEPLHLPLYSAKRTISRPFLHRPNTGPPCSTKPAQYRARSPHNELEAMANQDLPCPFRSGPSRGSRALS